MSKDTIYRQDAIDAVCKACSMEEDYHKCDGYPETSTWCDELVALRALPSAQPERKNDDLILVKGSKGEWILVKGSNGKDYHKCSECLHTQEITGVKNYCAVCGAEMVGKQNE